MIKFFFFLACPGFKLATFPNRNIIRLLPACGRDYSDKTKRPFFVPCDHNPCCDTFAPTKFRLIEGYANGTISVELYKKLSPRFADIGKFSPVNIKKQAACTGFYLKPILEKPINGQDYDPVTKAPIVYECDHEDGECDTYSFEKYLLVQAYAQGQIDDKLWEFLFPKNFEPWKNLSLVEWRQQVFCQPCEEITSPNEMEIVRKETEAYQNQIHSWWNYFPGTSKKMVYLARQELYIGFPIEDIPRLVLKLCKILKSSGENVHKLQSIQGQIDTLYNEE